MLVFIDTASVFFPLRSKVIAPLVPSKKGPISNLVLALTLTPVPANSVFSLFVK